jgi:hypothetical protein
MYSHVAGSCRILLIVVDDEAFDGFLTAYTTIAS